MSDQPVVDIIVKIQAQFADTIAQSNALKESLSAVLGTIDDLEKKTMNININLQGMGNVEAQFKQLSKFIETSIDKINSGKGNPAVVQEVKERLVGLNMINRSEVTNRKEIEKKLVISNELAQAAGAGYEAIKAENKAIKDGYIDIQTQSKDVTEEAKKAASVYKVNPEDFSTFNEHLEATSDILSTLSKTDLSFLEAAKKGMSGIKTAFPDMDTGQISAQTSSLVIPIKAAKSEIVAMSTEYSKMISVAGKAGGAAELKASPIIKSYEGLNKEILAADVNLLHLQKELTEGPAQVKKQSQAVPAKPKKQTVPGGAPKDTFNLKKDVSDYLTDVDAFVSKWKSTKMPFRNLFQLPDSIKESNDESRESFESLRDAVKSGNIMPELGDMDDPKRMAAVAGLNKALFVNVESC